METVVAEFFDNEFNSHIRDVLTEALAAGRAAYFTFNVFNVKLDPESGLATIEDELDPHREATIDLSGFQRMVERAESG